jgi:hypothetical protein
MVDLIYAPIDDSNVEYFWPHRGKDATGNWLNEPFPTESDIKGITEYFKNDADILRIEIERGKFDGSIDDYPLIKIHRISHIGGRPQIIACASKKVHGIP